MSAERNLRKTITGVVTSSARNKTIAVKVERKLKHPIYGKFVKLSKKFHAHDENNECREGDVVRLAECAPLSKTKNWRVVEIVARAG